MPADVRAVLMRLLARSEGLILVTGPTGSGKTSTLYAALNHLNTPDIHIVTAEDPIEYELQGATQVQVEGEQRSFARVLRAFLRQDFDVGLVGEIRDCETASVTLPRGGPLCTSGAKASRNSRYAAASSPASMWPSARCQLR